ncbi:cupin domain-containing protein [Mucilaginibacter sp. BJC16-A38]|uniref:cupin domain-containing protein n=1 Tax=Mucilaginibacter phenanthrenivorans TaxID=1234842 RepID=UPI0021576371|nr:cupin domain-containing protein [Mucilaginibacter phenanthrenivorans]MCR8561136.1 cupin domain-containing protein [Mucilaginibacter phenanthrenivorans]
MDEKNAAYWIDHLQLQPHPEGGYYREVFRSEIVVTGNDSFKFKRACTSIYYLLEGNDYSGFHRIQSDEIWYFHKGAPLHVHVIDENGDHYPLELSDSATGNLSLVVKAGLWFAAEIPSKTSFTLVSCAVAPGFEFSEFEMADKDKLTVLYPLHEILINRLSR